MAGADLERDTVVHRGFVLYCGIRTVPAGDSGEIYIVVLDDSGVSTSWGIGTGGPDLPVVPSGLLCREYLARPEVIDALDAMGDVPMGIIGSAPTEALTYKEVLSYKWVLAHWFMEGEPARMDVDGNGIPCELLFDPAIVAKVWAGDF